MITELIKVDGYGLTKCLLRYSVKWLLEIITIAPENYLNNLNISAHKICRSKYTYCKYICHLLFIILQQYTCIHTYTYVVLGILTAISA